MSNPGRVLVAKIGLDGHDRGVKVVARLLRDAGYEVIYTGLRQTPEMVVQQAIDEDVDVIGLSMLSGAHLVLVPRVLDGLRIAKAEIPLIVGGIIPEHDAPVLLERGAAAVLTPGTPGDAIINTVRSLIKKTQS